MHFFYAHPWFVFLVGGWLGVIAGCALSLLLTGSRMQRFEEKRAYIQMVLDRRNQLRIRLRRSMQQDAA
jgi:hypothetical protein